MGTKVQSESYLPGYSSMRNLKEDSSSSWPPYLGDKTLNEHLYSSFMLRPVNEYSGYDKEILKRTMLEHEATFRKQVCELHRLYRTQKDLMDELKEQELYKLPVQDGMSQSFLFSTAMASETTEKIWQMPHMTEVSTGFNKAYVAGTDGIIPPLDLLQKNYTQFSQIPGKNGVSLKDGDLSNSKLQSHARPMLDLQLPAELYIDVEDSDRIQQEHVVNPFCRVGDNSSVVHDIEHENDVKLTLGTRKDCSKGSSSSYTFRQKGQFIQSFDYLNESKQGLSCEGQSGSVSNHFLYVSTNREEVHGHQLPSRDFFTDKHRDEGACSNFLNADKEKAGLEWPSFNYEDGSSGNRVNSFTLGLSSEKCPMISEPSKLKFKREHNVPSYDHGEMQSWFEEKPTLGIGPYQKGSSVVDSNHSALTNYQVPGPFSMIPYAENLSCVSQMVSSRRKPPRVINYIPIAVQALPCFPASDITNSRSRKPKGSIQNSIISRNKLQPDADSKSHSRVGIELSASQNGFHQDLWSDSNSSIQFKRSSDSSVHEDSEGCPSQKFLKSQNDVSFTPLLPNGTREDGKLKESSEGVSWLRTKPSCTALQAEISFSKSFSQSPECCPSSSQVKESRKGRNETSPSVNTKKILGFPINDKLQHNAFCTPVNDIKTGMKTEVSEVDRVTEKCTRENIIDLNTMEISTEDEVPSITRKVTHEIDLEVPIPSYETLDISAAENLVFMSLDLNQQSTPASCDSLYWFANMVSSKESESDHDDNNGVDIFESLTLKLEEMKPDEYLPLPQEQENDPGTIPLLLTKTRRGQVRKRRQRKDFQKDILPGLVSLSRHQVTEDLQAFDFLMRAMGEAWESNLTRRRSTGQKGSSGRGRGRGRPRVLVVPISESCSQAAAPNSKVEIGERSIIGWGRRTRRGRRPRVRQGNASHVVS